MRVVYISGRLKGITILGKIKNIIIAIKYAKKYCALNSAVICPHTNSGIWGSVKDEKFWLKGDIAIIRRLRPKRDAIVMIPGWTKSQGAIQELAAARKRGLDVIFEED